MNYTKHIIIATTIIVIAIVGSILGSQKMKQDSIERQQLAEIEAENVKIEAEKEAERINDLLLDLCLSGADEEYWNYIKLNMEDVGDGKYTGPQYKWDRANEIKEKAEEKCFKQYK